MRTKINNFLIVLVTIILYSCQDSKPKQEDLIGVWRSFDGAYITLKKDGTCILQNVDYYKISSFPKNKNNILNMVGTWEFINNAESGIIDGIDKGILITYKASEKKIQGEIIFYISGQGILGYNKPWSLFIWDGDPDEMIKYEFIKD